MILLGRMGTILFKLNEPRHVVSEFTYHKKKSKNTFFHFKVVILSGLVPDFSLLKQKKKIKTLLIFLFKLTEFFGDSEKFFPQLYIGDLLNC